MSERKPRKKRFENSPQWLIGLLFGVVVMAGVALISLVGFQAQMNSAMVIGAVAGALVIAPAVMSEAAAGAFAMVLELLAQGAVLVITLPLLMIGSCGV